MTKPGGWSFVTGHWLLVIRGALLLRNLFALGRRQLVRLGLVLLEDVLHLVLGLLGVVLGHGLGLLLGLDMLVGVAADVAARHLGILGQFLDLLRQLGPLLAGHGRDLEADHLAIIVRGQAQVAVPDRLLDVLEGGRVKWLDQELLWFRRADRGKLLDRRRRAVVL